MADPVTLAVAGASLLQASSTRSAGKVAEKEAKLSAKSEEVAALSREAERKERLANALASQIATSGARGVSAFEGSPLTVLQEDVRREEEATERDEFQTRLSSLTKRARGAQQRRQANIDAGVGLLKSTAQISQTL